jgi:hypothetical protein
MNKHTPGPWFAEANDSYWEVNPMNGGDDGIPFSVANVCCSSPGYRDGGLQEANARLIAAAPELLEALRELLEDTQHANHDCGDLSYCPVSKARAAIAKATGA